MSDSIYLNDWAQTNYSGKQGREAMLDDFRIDEKTLEGVDILLASYTYECYSGSAFVLLRKDGKLYEVNGGHCSCYGLEGQWDIEETSIEALRKIRSYRYEGCETELFALLDQLEASTTGEPQ